MLTSPTLVDAVRWNARRFPGRDAVVDEQGRLTHRELADRVWALAAGLQRAGVRKGDHVGLLVGNTVFAAECFLGVIAAGGVAVFYNWRWASTELRTGITSTAAKLVFVEEQFLPSYRTAAQDGALEAVTCIPQGAEYDALHDGPHDRSQDGRPHHDGPPDVVVGQDDPMCILFTGGTTGISKGVVLPHRSGIFNALNEMLDCGMGREGELVGLNITPMFHSAALLSVFAPHFLSGGTNVLLGRFDEALVAETVARERVTTSFMIPNMIRRLIRTGALETEGFQRYFRQMHTGGGLLRMPDKQALARLLPNTRLFFRYGLTEAGPMVSRLLPADVMRPELDGSIGQEYSLAEVQVQDLDTGRECAPGELGEICVRGPAVMLGYFERPQETAAALRDGWLHTGDLAVRDEDGYLFFRDRAKDMIKTGGENVYAAEIEQLLYAHEAVMECGVLGVPSVEWDEEVRAVVALRDGHDVTEQELRDYLRQHLAGYKVPKVIQFVAPETMPVNPSGKIVKSQLRAVVGW